MRPKKGKTMSNEKRSDSTRTQSAKNESIRLRTTRAVYAKNGGRF